MVSEWFSALWAVSLAEAGTKAYACMVHTASGVATRSGTACAVITRVRGAAGAETVVLIGVYDAIVCWKRYKFES